MLVLKRKQGQSIIIGGNIVVKIIEVEGKSVKVGIEAPKHINIVREELLERAKEKMVGATVKPDTAKDVKISGSDDVIDEKSSIEGSEERGGSKQVRSERKREKTEVRENTEIKEKAGAVESSEEEKTETKGSDDREEEGEGGGGERLIIIKKSGKRASASFKGE